MQIGDFNVCDLVREHVQLGYSNRSDLAMLSQAQLQILVCGVNDGKRTRSKVDGHKVLVEYVKKNCACLDSV